MENNMDSFFEHLLLLVLIQYLFSTPYKLKQNNVAREGRRYTKLLYGSKA